MQKNLLTVFLQCLVWLIIVYCMKGWVTCYIYIYKNELWVYVTHQILQQSCTPFGTKSCFHAHLLAKRVHENRTKGVENKVDDTLKLAVFLYIYIYIVCVCVCLCLCPAQFRYLLALSHIVCVCV